MLGNNNKKKHSRGTVSTADWGGDGEGRAFTDLPEPAGLICPFCWLQAKRAGELGYLLQSCEGWGAHG